MQAIISKLQRRKVESNDSPHWPPQGSKLSPWLFSFYLADMPRWTEPVKRICYADDITGWASGVNILELGLYLDTFLSFNKHCLQVTNGVSKRNNVLKALAGTNCAQQNETLLMMYKALGTSIANYAAPVWSTNASESNMTRYSALRMRH